MSHRNFISSEIIEAILLWSPAKSLGRFKTVSKEWNSLISDPRFIKTHTHQLLHQPKPTNKLLAFSKPTSSLYSIELTIDNNDTIPASAKEITFGSLPPMQWNKIMGYCNGLVLARDVNMSIFLINPATLDLWKLPVNPFADDNDMYYASYGFGYDSSTDDYKVLCISAISKGSVSIYSLHNNLWRKLPNTPHDGYYWGRCAPVNGKCHFGKYSPSIIAFSFVDELFSEIKLPDSILDRNLFYVSAVVEIGGRLGLYMWVMQEYGDAKSWTRVFSRGEYMRPLCFLKGSYRDIVFNSVHDFGVFNIDEGKRKNVRIIGGSSRFTIEGSFGESIESTKRIITTP